MIKANELRIGNYVTGFDKYGSFGQILSIWDNQRRTDIKYSRPDIYLYDAFCGGLIEQLQPIPLTPEILEAAGFEQISNYHPEGPTHTLKHRNGITFEVCYLYHMVDIIENIGRIRIQNIKHLHQLQNLYFALAGSELEIKNLVEV